MNAINALSKKSAAFIFNLERKHILIAFRAIIFFLLLFFGLYGKKEFPNPFQSAIPSHVLNGLLILLGVHLSSTIGLAFIPKRHFNQWLYISLFFFDVILISIVLVMVNGFETDLFLVYFLVIFMTVIARSAAFSFIIAGLACVVYAAVFIKSQGMQDFLQPWILMRFCILLIVALFSSATVQEIETEKMEIELKHRKNQEQLVQIKTLNAIGRLAGGIAHDFNNLLTTITGHCILMMSHFKRDHPDYNDLEEIKKAADRAVTVTRQLLAFSRKQIFAPRQIDLNQLVINMKGSLHRLLGDSTQLEFLLNPNLKSISADVSQIEQVIANLILNARDSITENGRITISTENVILEEQTANEHPDTKPGPYVLLTIHDTGKGMEKDMIPHIFEPFFTTKGQSWGAGLGLSTVYGIIKQSKGDIWVQSEPGKGTAFQIYFPEFQTIEPLAEEKKMKPQPQPIPQTETILVVEDEDAVRRLTLKILKKNGYNVIEAPNGPEALSVCKQYGQPIHLLLTDTIMPNMNGNELAVQVQVLRPSIKIIYMSAYTDTAIVQQGILKANINFIEKPFTPEILSRKVREVLDH